MTWHAIYETATGRLVSVGSVIDTLGEGLSDKQYADQPVGEWNESTLDFDPPPPIRVIRDLVFISRFTPGELRGILGVDFTTTDPAVVAFVRFLNIVDSIDLDSDLITLGLTKLVAAGLLTATRANEVLVDGVPNE